MNPGPRVTVVASRTIDRLLTPSGPLDLPGGPAHYIGDTLSRLSCPWELVTGEEVIVQVTRSENGEVYHVPPIPPISLPARFKADAAILSPIMREILPEQVPVSEGLLAVDLQGFVRAPGRPSDEPALNVDLRELIARTDVVKGGVEEIAALTPDTRRELGHAIVAVTRGRQGITLCVRGEEFAIPAHPLQVPHAIGAGDALLAALVWRLIEGDEPDIAGKRAVAITESVLRERRVEPLW